jgi:tetratricopeptide (TPR) repeat protein
MSKYYTDLDYIIFNVDISEDELKEISKEADFIIKDKNAGKKTLFLAYIKKAQIMLINNIETNARKSSSLIKRTLKLYPDSPQALLLMGKYYAFAHSKEHDNDKALTCYNHALAIKPDYAAVYVARADIYCGDDKRRIIDCTTAIQLKPDYAEALWWRANSYSANNDPDKAIEDYSEVIRLKPNWGFMYSLRGDVYYYEKDDYDRAITDYTEAIRYDSDRFNYKYRGRVYDKKGERDKALDDFIKFLTIGWHEGDEFGNDYREPFYGNGDITHETKNECSEKIIGEYDRTIADYGSALLLNPGDLKILQNRAELYFKKGDYENTITDCTEIIRIVDNMSALEIYDANADIVLISAYERRADAWHEKEEDDKALADLSESIYLSLREGIGGLRPYLNRANIYTDKGEYKKAIEDITIGLRFSFPPDLIHSAFMSRGALFNEIGNFDKSIRDFSEAIRIKPDYAETYSRRGEVYYKKHQCKKALAGFDKAIYYDPNDEFAFFNRGQLFQHKKEYGKALADYQEAIRLYPDYTEAIHNRDAIINKMG